MRIDDALFRPGSNNFTAVRLFLASAVIYSHGYQIISGDHTTDGLSKWLGSPVSTYAVDGFFFLSGFLVYPSLQRLGEPLRFLGARLARLWPGLAMAVGVTVIGGVFATTALRPGYLGGATSHFMFGNLTFSKAYYTLTGVNCGAAACNVNESLWTLPWEARCYLALAILGYAGLSSARNMARFVLPATLVGVATWDSPVRAFAAQTLSPGMVFLIDIFDRLWPLFALGAAAYIFRRRLRLSWLLLAALFAATVLSKDQVFFQQVRAIFVGYAVLCFGLLSASRGAISGKWHDYSYGMYIYAAPVMLVLHTTFGRIPYLALAAATWVVTLVFAAPSWHFLEKPALEAYRRRAGKTSASARTPSGVREPALHALPDR